MTPQFAFCWSFSVETTSITFHPLKILIEEEEEEGWKFLLLFAANFHNFTACSQGKTMKFRGKNFSSVDYLSSSFFFLFVLVMSEKHPTFIHIHLRYTADEWTSFIPTPDLENVIFGNNLTSSTIHVERERECENLSLYIQFTLNDTLEDDGEWQQQQQQPPHIKPYT